MSKTTAEIRDRLNIVDVISSYIPLKKAGVNYKASCPFHQEKSASFIVSPTKQIWHCFGCSEGGNIFDFVMKYENLEFKDALKILAEKAGVKLEKITKEQQRREEYREVLVKINDLAAKFYHQVLMQSSVAAQARTYLEKRALKNETIKEWQIGMAPNDFHVLENFLLKKGFKKNELVDAGVSSKSQHGGIYDRFIDRITFPIKNKSGETVGFTARVLNDQTKTAKYLNTPETEIYHKSSVIFGFYQAKREISKSGSVVVVEGNMDVIAAHQAGFKNVVGSSGTAFTEKQLADLGRFTKKIIFAFDADQAGGLATERTIFPALEMNVFDEVRIALLKGAKDPDDLIKKDPKLFAAAIAEAPLYTDYIFEKAVAKYDGSLTSEKKVFDELSKYFKAFVDELTIAHYRKKLAEAMGISELSLVNKLGAIRPKMRQAEKIAPLKDRTYFLEERIVGYAMYQSKYRAEVLKKVNAKDFKNQVLAEIFEHIAAADNVNQDFINQLSADSELAKMALFVVESGYSQTADQQQFEREFNKILKEFKQNSAKLQLNALVNEIVSADKQKNKQKVQELNQKFLELSKALKDIEL